MPRFQDMASILGGGYYPDMSPWEDEKDTYSLPVVAPTISGTFTPPVNDPYGGLGSTPYTAPAWSGLTTNTEQGDLNWPNYQNDETGFFDWLNSGSGDGGGGGIIAPPAPSAPEGPGEIEWILGDYDVGGQGPDWWRPFTVKNKEHFSNPSVSATLMMNALIGSGSMSDEDARSMAKQLYATWGGQTADNPWDLYSTKFGEREDMFGSPTMQGSFDPRISEQQVALGQTGPGTIGMDRFSRERSEQALNALSMMREATVGGNVHEFGPGYQYLQEVAGTLGEAGSGPASRAEREQILGALDPMMAMSQGGELAGFSQMAQALANPFFTNLPPNVSRTQAGDYQFGRQSKDLFF